MRKLLLISSFLALGACSNLSSLMTDLESPFTPPHTVSQDIIAADELAAAMINSAADLEAKGLIVSGSSTEKTLSNTFKVITTSLDQANKEVQTGDTTSAGILLATAQGAISGVQSVINQVRSTSGAK